MTNHRPHHENEMKSEPYVASETGPCEQFFCRDTGNRLIEDNLMQPTNSVIYML